MIEQILKAMEIKDEKRTGWELRNIEDPESVADHTWGTAFNVLIHAPEGLDQEKALKMALIHDIGEAEVGDIAHRAIDAEEDISSEEKEKMETEAVEKLSKALGEELFDLWNEYEQRETKEAKFVKDMDLIDMCLTALKYEKEKRYDPQEENENFQEYDNLDEFFATSESRISTLKGQELFREIREKYRDAKQ